MDKTPLHAGLTLRLYRDDKVFGAGAVMLLELVRETHSLRAAALALNMAYSKAWKVIKQAEEGLGFPLLHSEIGGNRGGGATLTPQAEALVERYRAFEADIKSAMESAYRKHFADFLE